MLTKPQGISNAHVMLLEQVENMDPAIAELIMKPPNDSMPQKV